MNFTNLTQNIIFILLFLSGTMTSVFSQCEIGSSPDCPYVYTVCSGEQTFISMGDLDIPPPPIVIQIDVGVFDFSNVSYSFSTEDGIVCTDCYYLQFAQHDETTLYTVEWVNTIYPTPPDQFSGTKYILIEVEECELSSDIGNVSLTQPSQITSTGYQPISYYFSNMGTGYIYSYDAFLEINGEIVQQETVELSSPIESGYGAYGSFDAYDFEALQSGYNIKIRLANPNGFQDTDPSNNSVEVDFAPFTIEYDIALGLISPELPFENGNHDVIVRVRNFGNVEIDDFIINWSINGQMQPTYTGVDLLANEYRSITLGSHSLDINTDCEILINAELPNGFVDSTPSNNTQSFIYDNANYQYYLTDEFHEICPGDSVNLIYYSQQFNGGCYNCGTSFKEGSWTIDGVEISTENNIWVAPESSVTVQLSGTTDYECYGFGCNPSGPAGPYPGNSYPTIDLSFGIIVNNCNEEITEIPNCANHAGTIFFETCNNQQYFFIETSDGTILDPYFANGISFNYHDGQSINFDYETAEFTTPCENAQKTVIITCIEEDNSNASINTNTAIFNDFPWLSNTVDSTDCNGTTIEVYDLGSYAFINIITTEASILYFEDGTYYCQNGDNLDCTDAYGLGNPTNTWTCGDGTTPSGNNNNEIFNTYSWLGDFIDQNNCAGTTINLFDLGSYAFIQIIDNDNATLYFQDGSLYCQNGNNLNCIEAYSLGSPTDTWTCGNTTPPNNGTICELDDIKDSQWVLDLLDIEVYSHINIFESNGSTLFCFYSILPDVEAVYYNCDGELVCVLPGLIGPDDSECLDMVNEATLLETIPIPDTPTNNNEIFDTYSWLGDFIEQNNCAGTTVNVFDLGSYAFIQIIDNNNATLYFQDGSLYCQNGNNLNCVEAYSLGSPTDTWTCGQGSPNPPTATPAIFDKYPWLSNSYAATDCNGSYESITEYDLGPYSFIYVQGNGFGMLYFEDGSPYCNSADFDCLAIYSLTNPTDVTLCSMDKPAPAGKNSENTIGENAHKTPIELIPDWLVYPNPTSGSFIIKLNGQNNDLNHINIYDIQGKTIEEILIKNNQPVLKFNLEHLNIGMYFVALQYGDKTEVKKLIIKK